MDSHLFHIAIGSNMANAPRVLEWTRRKLRAKFGTMCRFSHPVWTEPIDYPYPFPFLNQVAEITTNRPLGVLEALLKAMEKEMMHRRCNPGEGRRIVDIDLLSFDGEVLRPDDWERPYVKDGIAALAASPSRKL